MKLRVILIALLILVVVVFFLTWLQSPSKEPFGELSPVDDFFMRMSKPDLYARQVADELKFPSDYRDFYYSNVKEPTAEQASILRILCTKADELIRDYGFKDLLDVPWKFKIIADSRVENGFPHTLGDTIYISDSVLNQINSSSDLSVVKTLIHERIHLYQKANGTRTSDLIKKWGFKPSKMRDELQRNNPDLDGINYSYKDYVILQRYKSPKPSSLLDSDVVIVDQKMDETPVISAALLGFPGFIKQFEHPLEIMACLLAELIVNGDKGFIENEKVVILRKWLKI